MRPMSLMMVLALGGCVLERDGNGFPDTGLDGLDPTELTELTEVLPPPAICSVVPDGGQLCPTDASPIAFEMIGPNVQLVVDRSGSMQGAKWQEMEALTAMLPLVGARANLGLTFFPAPTAVECGTENGTVVPMSEGMAAAGEVANWLLSTSPSGSTPIGDTVHGLIGEPALQCPNRDNIVVLLSDGAESCGGHPVAAVDELVRQPEPVEVYVIGFATSASANNTLERIADAAWPTTEGENFFTASTADELVARLAAVTATCTAQIGEDFDPDALEVTLDGRTLDPCIGDHCAGGYTVDEQWGNIRIEGDDCLSMLDGECHDLQFAHAL